MTEADRVPQASEALVRERASKLVADGGAARVLVLRSRPRWTGPAELRVGPARVLVRPAVSQLAALDALAERRPDDYLILLSDRTEQDLGDAVLVRAERHRVELLDEWAVVPGLFAAHRIDPALRAAGAWVPGALLEYQPSEGWPQVRSGVLSADHALGNLLGALLRQPLPVELDLVALLAATEDPAGREGWRQSPERLRVALASWAGHGLGPAAEMVLAAAARGPISPVAIGLAMDVLWPTGSTTGLDPEQGPARGRIESRVHGRPVQPSAARAYAAAARTLVLRMDGLSAGTVPAVLAQAEALLADLGWSAGAERSAVLPAGLRARLRTLAGLLGEADVTALVDSLPRIEGALTDVTDHERADVGDPAVLAARMAVRLARWLGAQVDPPAPTDLGAALRRYVDDAAWVDRAAAVVWDGSTDDVVIAGYRSLLHLVRRLRSTQDRDAAAALAEATARDQAPAGAALIEDVLADVVWPIAADLRPLVILLDGMSVPVATELADEIVAAGWVELVPAVSGRRLPVLAALPTLTRYSRTSFFAGALREGTQSAETPAVRDRFGARLFHKDDLRAPAGEGLPGPVRQAIEDPEQRMVAVVLNTIDDALDKHDPGGTRWSLRDVRYLAALLQAAAAAGRAVVLTSDHGHVVERGSEVRAVPGAEARWRPVGAVSPASDEVLLRGRRVLTGGEAVLAWREDLRYTALRSGYHGGASLAEITVPFLLLTTHRGTPPSGWVEAAPQAPSWWNEAERPDAGGMRRARRTVTVSGASVDLAPPQRGRARPTRTEPDDGPQGVLALDLPGPTPERPPSSASLTERLVASETYAAQRRRAGRHALAEDKVTAVLGTLLDRSGRAHRDTLAAVVGVPASSFPQTFAALTRLLNVEGYPVLSMDPDGVTVRVDEVLLREQFELEQGRG